MENNLENFIQDSKIRISKLCQTINSVDEEGGDDFSLTVLLEIFAFELMLLGKKGGMNKEELGEYVKFINDRHFKNKEKFQIGI